MCKFTRFWHLWVWNIAQRTFAIGGLDWEVGGDGERVIFVYNLSPVNITSNQTFFY